MKSCNLQMSTSAPRLRDETGLFECCCNPWIKLDSSVVIVRKFFVTLLASFVDPFLKVFTHQSVDDITHILSSHLLSLSEDRKSINNDPKAHAVVEDL